MVSLHKHKALIFGSGLVYRLIIEDVCDLYEVVAILDNDSNKQGLSLNNTTILSPDCIKNIHFDVIILASSDVVNMAKQLNNLGISHDRMIVGANYALNKYFNKTSNKIDFFIDYNSNILIDNAFNKDGLICVDAFFDKKIVFHKNNIPTLLGLCDENNRIPSYFELSKKYYGNQKGIFLDIGANIGTSSLEAISFEQVSQCIAFEPSSDNFALLSTNIAINHLNKNIISYQYAVSDIAQKSNLLLSDVCSGDNMLTVYNTSSVDSQLKNHSKNEVVETIVIDDFFVNQLNEIRFLWIDVQGYEYFVLQGCKKLLNTGLVSVQIEYWPYGLRKTNSLETLNQLLTEEFRFFIDLNEYKNSESAIYNIQDIWNLETKLLKKGQKAHTDLFLIKQ